MPQRQLAFPQADCADCPIRHRAVCARCETDELEHLEAIKYYRNYEAGQTIVWAGDKMDFVASVVHGVAALTQTMEDGRRQMVGLLLPSDFLGRPNRERATYDVTATTDLQLCCFRRAPFQEMLKTNAHVSQRLLEMTLDELDAAREWMLLLGRKTARERVATFLLGLAERARRRGDAWSPLALPMGRTDIADHIGLTVETVSRAMTWFKRQGLIDLPNPSSVSIRQPDALRAIADGSAGV